LTALARPDAAEPGRIVILNGAPRSGRSSIARAIQETLDGAWLNLGVDLLMAATPHSLAPGVGLRAGGERPDLEPVIPTLYGALFESIAAASRLGLNVVADVGLHDSFSSPQGILADLAARLTGLPVLFVGVRCPIEEIMRRRNASPPGSYATGRPEEPPPPVLLWQSEVHKPGVYDLESDTSISSPVDCATVIARALDRPPRRERGAAEPGRRSLME
jgi:chloramphenicol 3-O phosphotransferase